MKRLRKSNSVSWANGSSLCQVRLFACEDCPSEVGNGGQDSLKIKSTNLQHSKNNHLNEIPPGFVRPTLTNIRRTHFCRIPWNCPPKFGLSFDWNVVAGEESQEVNVQAMRESRVFEALYPSPSVIPANSSVSLDIEREFYDDTLTSTIPVIPIEEEEEMELASISLNSQPLSLNQPFSVPNSGKCNTPSKAPVPGILPDQNACLVTAAAFEVMKSKEQGSLVDTDMLIKILSDPKMVSKLAQEFQKPTISCAGEPIVVSKPVTQLALQSFPNSAPGRNSDNEHHGFRPSSPTPSRSKPAAAAERAPVRFSGVIPVVGNSTSTTKQVQTNLNTAPSLESTVSRYVGTNSYPFLGTPKTMAQACVKDINYMKNLIREHGTDKKQDTTVAQNVPDLNNMRPRQLNPKYQKACFYFNTPVGCRNGTNCPYQHDVSYQLQTGISLEAPPLKRMRFSGEVSW